ncbi:MAG: hypothetical protein J5723_08325 [Ruminococcus sp.]|nr:hypothetical protein [Ruminococcus sp.]
MKNLTSKIIRAIYILSSILMLTFGVAVIYEIISAKAATDPYNHLIEGLFWSAFSVYHLCHWYIIKHNNIIKTY